MRRSARQALCLLACLCALAAPVGAQERPVVLFVDPEAVLQNSESGQAVLEEIESDRAALVAETESLSAAFEEEERELTELRETLPRPEFQALAEEFDTRVRRVRAEQDQKAAELTRRSEARRRQFFSDLNALYAQFLRESGASAIIDIRSVILANRVLDITPQVIARIDETRTPLRLNGAPLDGGDDPE